MKRLIIMTLFICFNSYAGVEVGGGSGKLVAENFDKVQSSFVNSLQYKFSSKININQIDQIRTLDNSYLVPSIENQAEIINLGVLEIYLKNGNVLDLQ